MSENSSLWAVFFVYIWQYLHRTLTDKNIINSESGQ